MSDPPTDEEIRDYLGLDEIGLEPEYPTDPSFDDDNGGEGFGDDEDDEEQLADLTQDLSELDKEVRD